MPIDQAKVSVEDRGFLLADGVYEVVRYYHGRPRAMDRHLARLDFSLQALRIHLPETWPLDRFAEITDQLIQLNQYQDASAYWQVTRGAAPRSHPFPTQPVEPTIYLSLSPAKPVIPDAPVPTYKAITLEDNRWGRCDIKSIALLPNVLAAQQARDAGCFDAILVRNDIVTEGTARSIVIVDNGQLMTHPLDGSILGSVTRSIVLEIARSLAIPVSETYFNQQKLMNASEVIGIGTSTEIAAVTHINDQPIGSDEHRGAVGPVTRQLSDVFRRRMMAL